jgi:hypothetical protein
MTVLPYSIEDLRQAFTDNKIVWRDHAAEKMTERNILRSEVRQCIMSGEIIEKYIGDKPFPSCLVFGVTIKNRPLHTVCSISGGYIYIITAYEPNTFKWHNDLKTRRK